MKFWKHALIQHILGAVGGDIAHFQVRAGATHSGTSFDPVASISLAHTMQ